MTLHHRSKISTVIDYSDYFTVNSSLGCCCKITFGSPVAEESSFAACNAIGGFYIIPEANQTCASVPCPVGGYTGCCCACKYLTPEQRALVEADILGATYGMVDGVPQCECEDIGGKWILGPCDRSKPTDFCRKPNGVDVRLPKACCGATFIELTNNGVVQIVPSAFCEDVCTPKECSDNTILNYIATYYSNGRRCFYENNAGPPVASFECLLRESQGADGTIAAPFAVSTLPVCNNSNFYCWGNNCKEYVNLINNGIYTTPTVNDYLTVSPSGAAQKLSDFNDIDEGKNIIGNGLFEPYTKNYSYIRARYGKAALITLDNKVVFNGAQALGFQNGIEYTPLNYNTTPFYKYDRVEIGKNFAILRKQSNIGTRADFFGYLTQGVTVSNVDLNLSGIETVHALEEAVCITRLNFLTNNIELYCQGYPFNRERLTRVDGGVETEGGIIYNYTIIPESVSCNGFHCTYKRRKLDANKVLQKTEWVTQGEYKRTRTIEGFVIEAPEGRILKDLVYPEEQFIEGIVVAGQNFDCFLEGVYNNEQTGEGYTNLSCIGAWDPDDTNTVFSTIENHEFGLVAEIPGPGGMYADCDYNKCFAVSPILEYCEDTRFGNCCIRNDNGCECRQNITRQSCDAIQNSQFYLNSEYTCLQCLTDCETGDGTNGDGEDGEDGSGIPTSCLTTTAENGVTTKRGACCIQITCNTGHIKYACSCRRQQSCNLLGGTFYENKTVDDSSVNCGPTEDLGNCCFTEFLGPGMGFNTVCLNDQMTGLDCRTCIAIQDGSCVEYNSGGNAITPGNRWSIPTAPCCGC